MAYYLKDCVKYAYKDNQTVVVTQSDYMENPRHNADMLWNIVVSRNTACVANTDIGDIVYTRTNDKRYDTPNDDWNDVVKHHLQGKKSQYVAFTIKKYEHSQITLSLTSLDDCCNGFDYGVYGFMFAKKADIAKWFNAKKCTKSLLEQAEKIATNELYQLEKYINGESYEYVVYDGIIEAHIDLATLDYIESCTGFYEPEEALNYALLEQAEKSPCVA